MARQLRRRSSIQKPPPLLYTPSWNIEWISKCVLCSMLFFYLGITVGWSMREVDNCNRSDVHNNDVHNNDVHNNILKNNDNIHNVNRNVAELRLGRNNANGIVRGTTPVTAAEGCDDKVNNNNNNNNNTGTGDATKNATVHNRAEHTRIQAMAEELEIVKSLRKIDMEHMKKLQTELETKLRKLEDETKEQQRQQQQQQHQNRQARQQQPQTNNNNNNNNNNIKPHYQDFFSPRSTGDFASGMEFVDRDDFAAAFDTGVPFDKSGRGNDQVLILYSDKKAMPDANATRKERHPNNPGGNTNTVYSATDATANCLNLHVVLTSERRKQQCVAVMGQLESFHLHKFMRMADADRQAGRIVDKSLPLRLVNRGMQLNGERSHSPPARAYTRAFWESVTRYLGSLEGVLEELKPIAKAVAAKNEHNTIVVLVSNRGHSEFLVNFVCHSVANGLERALESVLVFATDGETHELASSIGLASFYSETVFRDTPEQAAEEYADEVYSRIMGAKVYCVHMVSQLGHDFIFQDVDVIWYKDPLQWFHRQQATTTATTTTTAAAAAAAATTKSDGNKNPPSQSKTNDWDMIFQDDGGRSLDFSPYSSNSGFYFVRNNRKTQHFFNSLLMMGDMILSSGSHQAVLVVLLSEHASLFGLKVKTWNRMAQEFPGGYSYHKEKEFMRKLIRGRRKNKNATLPLDAIEGSGEGTIDPYVFHMSWTHNKVDKIKYFQQMGDWFVEDKCIPGSGGESALANTTTASAPATRRNCCSAKPLIKCHFRDKPSIVPCPDAPPSTRENTTSFW